jgi:hypothetical protein
MVRRKRPYQLPGLYYCISGSLNINKICSYLQEMTNLDKHVTFSFGQALHGEN